MAFKWIISPTNWTKNFFVGISFCTKNTKAESWVFLWLRCYMYIFSNSCVKATKYYMIRPLKCVIYQSFCLFNTFFLSKEEHITYRSSSLFIINILSVVPHVFWAEKPQQTAVSPLKTQKQDSLTNKTQLNLSHKIQLMKANHPY